jgi:hypothetical protein
MPRMSPRVPLVLAAAAVATALLTAGPASAQVRDTTPPAITFTVPAEGQVFASDQGNVPTVFTCHDDTDPTPRCEGPAFIDTTQVGDHIFTVTGTDATGNSAPQFVHYRVVDMIPPQITITVPTPNQHFPQHTAQDATFNCTDTGGSLIDTCATASALNGDTSTGIDTSTPGPHVLDVVAIDGAGNRTTMSVPYIVDPALEFDPDLDHNSQSVLSAAVPALKRLAHGKRATISVQGARPNSRVAVRVTGRHGKTVATGSGRVGANAAVTFTLRAKHRRLVRGRLHLFVTVTGTDGRVSRRNRFVRV